MVNFNDIAGKYSGITFGIANTFGTISGIVAPSFVGFLAKNGTQAEWSLVFYVTAIIYLIGALVFVWLASGETESWAKQQSSTTSARDGDQSEQVPLNRVRI